MDDSTPAPRFLDPQRFECAWRALGAVQDAPFSSLAVRYAEPHRAYHDAEHINECLSWLDRVRDLAVRLAELEVAVYFHDAIYDPRAHDNEQRSADLFRQQAALAGIGPDVVERVTGLIESTARHAQDDGDAALLSDIDLSILGASPSRYARFERDIRREYAMFDDASYRAGRAHVLRGFLERTCIYRTPRLAAQLEAQARDNLSNALSALQQKI
jgi:predicted metal-dependent HD superfamily phosphohydrolase